MIKEIYKKNSEPFHKGATPGRQVTKFDISSKFTLFWGQTGAKAGVKMGKNVPITR